MLRLTTTVLLAATVFGPTQSLSAATLRSGPLTIDQLDRAQHFRCEQATCIHHHDAPFYSHALSRALENAVQGQTQSNPAAWLR